MTGTFPGGIASFPFLSFLSFSSNVPPDTGSGGALPSNLGLSGSLPAILGDMKHLVNVELAGNLFHGTIPGNWYQSRSFQKINVGANMLTGSISADIGKWKNLNNSLYLYQNMLTGTIPSAIGGLESLHSMLLSKNALIGTIPTEIGNIRNLYTLALDWNKLTGTISSQIALMNLADLSLRENRMSGTIPIEMSNLMTRSVYGSLDLANNQFSGAILPLLNLTYAVTISIENNQFSGTLPRELGRFSNLAVFVASGNRFVGTVPQRLCKLRSPDKGILSELQLDCAAASLATIEGSDDATAVPEISCPVGCCTRCCDSNGENCQAMMND